MEKRGGAALSTLQTVVKAVLVMAVLCAAGLLVLAGVTERGTMQPDAMRPALYALWGAAAFGAAAVASFGARRHLLAKCMLAQAVFLVLILLAGVFLWNAAVDWQRAAPAGAAAVLGTTGAVLLFGKRKKSKNFRKNTPIRLKKK